MTPKDEPMKEDKPVTFPEHDCKDLLNNHWHTQEDCTYETCGICGKILAFDWKIPKYLKHNSKDDQSMKDFKWLKSIRLKFSNGYMSDESCWRIQEYFTRPPKAVFNYNEVYKVLNDSGVPYGRVDAAKDIVAKFSPPKAVLDEGGLIEILRTAYGKSYNNTELIVAKAICAMFGPSDLDKDMEIAQLKNIILELDNEKSKNVGARKCDSCGTFLSSDCEDCKRKWES